MYRIGNEEVEAVRRVIESKELFKVNRGTLQETANAEKELCKIMGTDYAIVMTSGHAALVSALVGLGVGPGDQVIIPAYTYIATAIAVLEAGAIPVIAEIDDSLTLDPKDVEKKITKHTKAIIPVHIKGFPSDMEAICNIAKKHGIAVVEDACQADGASFKGKRLGAWGDAGAFSFNFFKIISMGEGGAMITSNRQVFERGLIYHDSSACAYFGNQIEDFTTTPFCGSEYRTNEISAAILRQQLKRLDGIIADLRKNKKYIMDNLSDLCGFIRSNDIEGDLGTTVGMYFKTSEEAARVAKILGTENPVFTKKHVYTDWKPILNKRGAHHPALDPFMMKENQGIVPDYTVDMCPKSLEHLSRTVYIEVNPDWTTAELDQKIETVRAALKK
jgi:dTDP-4-amino-4,6-dideoxygalactose transaminase